MAEARIRKPKGILNATLYQDAWALKVSIFFTVIACVISAVCVEWVVH
jgi:hypothetical protein